LRTNFFLRTKIAQIACRPVFSPVLGCLANRQSGLSVEKRGGLLQFQVLLTRCSCCAGNNNYLFDHVYLQLSVSAAGACCYDKLYASSVLHSLLKGCYLLKFIFFLRTPS